MNMDQGFPKKKCYSASLRYHQKPVDKLQKTVENPFATVHRFICHKKTGRSLLPSRTGFAERF
jgi:hypothetical protein